MQSKIHRFTKTGSLLLLSLFFLGVSRAEEMQGPHFQFFNKGLTCASHGRFPADSSTNGLFRKGLMISSFHTLVPIATGILLTSVSRGQTPYKTVGKLLLGYGFLLGPSMGHFYLKNARRGFTGLLIRSFGTLLIAGAAVGAAASALCEDDCYADDILGGTCRNACPSDAEITRAFFALAIPGAVLLSWSIIKGFLSLKKSAAELQRKNEKLGFFLEYRNQFRLVQIRLTYSF